MRSLPWKRPRRSQGPIWQRQHAAFARFLPYAIARPIYTSQILERVFARCACCSPASPREAQRLSECARNREFRKSCHIFSSDRSPCAALRQRWHILLKRISPCHAARRLIAPMKYLAHENFSRDGAASIGSEAIISLVKCNHTDTDN